MPLPALLRLIEDIPAAYKNAAGKLSHVSVHNINIGVNRQRVSDYHWVYFPEPDLPFYRVGFYSNFSPHMAPRNTSSLYIEISSRPAAPQDPATLLAASIDSLRQCGILKKKDRIVAQHATTIDYAYVVFDRLRSALLPPVVACLKKNGVLSAGRYGGWTYDSMADALVQGKRIAGTLA
jgi:protoporphyrinogen oxidase